MGKFVKKLAILMCGLIIMGFGTAMSFQSNMGLSPWDVLNHGLSVVTGLEVGKANILCGFLILIIVMLCREKVGFGTFINILVIGSVLDLVLAIGIIPSFGASQGYENIVPRLALCVGSMFFMSLGMYLYMSVQLGAGPRDSLMVMLTKRTPLRVGMVRVIIEGIAFVVGWLLGGKIGIGSVILVLLSGPIMELVFRLFKFDVKKVHNQSINDTLAEIRGASRS